MSSPKGAGGVFPHLRENLLVLVNEYVRKYRKPFRLETCKDVLRRVAVALQKLHGKNWRYMGRKLSQIPLRSLPLLTHRADLKPDNILVDYTDHGDGRLTIRNLMLADFDLAWKDDDGNASFSCNQRVGHQLWQSPEAIASKNVDKPSDVFAFGLTVS